MTKTLNQIFFFPQSKYFFQQHWESEYFFRKKNIPPPPPPPPWKLNGPSLGYCKNQTYSNNIMGSHDGNTKVTGETPNLGIT